MLTRVAFAGYLPPTVHVLRGMYCIEVKTWGAPLAEDCAPPAILPVRTHVLHRSGGWHLPNACPPVLPLCTARG
jgi:hypothetical protein